MNLSSRQPLIKKPVVQSVVQLCEWFFLCKRPATGIESHPVLGEVPICARCAAWIVEALLGRV